MTTTDKHEALLIEAATHHEGTEGYVQEKLGQIAIIHARVAEIHVEIAARNMELKDLANLAWGYQCDIAQVRGSNGSQTA